MPVSVAKRRGRENTPAPTIEPTTIAVSVVSVTRLTPFPAGAEVASDSTSGVVIR
jgi:hypothetical protein